MSDATTLPVFHLSRRFAAPRDTVWAAFTKADQLKQWWGPKDFTVGSAQLNLVPGGLFVFQLLGPENAEMWGRWLFREIAPTRRLEVLHGFADASGHSVRHPAMSDWPQDMLGQFGFHADGGETRLELDFSPYQASAAEAQVFGANLESLNTGFSGTFDKLDAFLAKG
ncbi:ATPase [Azorhizobium oxalatiphilum]|uniref:ATPase n=1 Tax=Azorhizobium oxalatiphilum TaxID=980631 RepID=A0A917BQL2_9HYPH|nr:SRPBCC domain-containing protein [Azorhizobium oxalatiphilum]GGF55090.1 ATPase [Azorhizobium oxalatiphilum]